MKTPFTLLVPIDIAQGIEDEARRLGLKKSAVMLKRICLSPASVVDEWFGELLTVDHEDVEDLKARLVDAWSCQPAPKKEVRPKERRGFAGRHVVCIETGIEYGSCALAGESVGETRHGIYDACVGRRIRPVGGYHWKWAD